MGALIEPPARPEAARNLADLNLARVSAAFTDLLLPAWIVFRRMDYATLVQNPEALPPLVTAAVCAYLLYLFASFVAFRRTPGQFLFELRIGRGEGRRATASHLAARALLFGVIGPVDELVLLLRGGRAGLVDRLSGTGVEDQRRRPRGRGRDGLALLRMALMLATMIAAFHLLFYLVLNVLSVFWLGDDGRHIQGVREVRLDTVQEAGWETVYRPGLELQFPFAVEPLYSHRNSISISLLPDGDLEDLILRYQRGSRAALFLLAVRELRMDQGQNLRAIQSYYPEGVFYRRFWQAQARPYRINSLVANAETFLLRYLYHRFPLECRATRHGSFEILLSDAGWEGVLVEQPRIDEVLLQDTFYDVRYELDIIYGDNRYLRLDAYLPAGASEIVDRMVATVRRRRSTRLDALAMYETCRRYRELNDEAYPSEFFLALAAVLDPANPAYLRELVEVTERKRTAGVEMYGVLERYRSITPERDSRGGAEAVPQQPAGVEGPPAEPATP